MELKLEQIVPWGRSFEEYTQMFDLGPEDLQVNILDVAGGPASFNAEMTQQGHRVISCDPIYQFSAKEIASRVESTHPLIMQGVAATHYKFVWKLYRTPEHLAEVRMAAMGKFLEDFPIGLQQGRYRTDSLPSLSFDSGQFDLALCSHLLFTYSDQLSLEFHLSAIQEMVRVATQVRIFPLLVNMTGETSPYLEPVVEALKQQGYSVQIKLVPYEFQKGGNQCLQVHR